MDRDKTQTNDELETNHEEHEADSTTESEGEATEERTYTEAELNERLEAERKERDKRWRERLKKAGGEDSEGGRQESEKKAGSQEVASNDVVLARLEARGVLDTDIQDYLLGEAKRLQKNPVELLTDPYYSTKIEEKKREKEQEAARPAPSSRTGQTDRSGDINYHLQRAKDGKGLPSDPAMRRKVVAKLAGR